MKYKLEVTWDDFVYALMGVAALGFMALFVYGFVWAFHIHPLRVAVLVGMLVLTGIVSVLISYYRQWRSASQITNDPEGGVVDGK